MKAISIVDTVEENVVKVFQLLKLESIVGSVQITFEGMLKQTRDGKSDIGGKDAMG